MKARDGYLEVPWREGTRTNSARRSDLIRLLAPAIKLPQFEVVGGKVELYERSEAPRNYWKIQFGAYVIPADDRRLVIPFHYISLRMKVGPRPIPFLRPDISLPRPSFYRYERRAESMLTLTERELIANGPGHFTIASDGALSDAPVIEGDASLTVYFRPAGSPNVATAIGEMIEVPEDLRSTSSSSREWTVAPRGADLTLPWSDETDDGEN